VAQQPLQLANPLGLLVSYCAICGQYGFYARLNLTPQPVDDGHRV